MSDIVFIWYLVEKKHWAFLVHFKTTLSNFFSTSTHNNKCFSTTILRCKESCVCVCVTHLSFIWDTGEWSRRNKHKWVSDWIWGTKYTHTELSCNAVRGISYHMPLFLCSVISLWGFTGVFCVVCNYKQAIMFLSTCIQHRCYWVIVLLIIW